MKVVRTETLDVLLEKYPANQWWRLFIDGYRQYSLINREPTDENEADKQNATLSFKSKIYPDLVQSHHKNTPLLIRPNDEEHAKIMEIMGKSLSRIPDNAVSDILKKQLTPAATSHHGKIK